MRHSNRRLTPRQKSVIGHARRGLKKLAGIKSVCLDTLPTDAEIKVNFTKAVNVLIDDTIYWNL